ncbi:hypothetical protein RAAC3_TM7C00001G0463 [Candidatus Saccharibacteria bacterium RAAC3_TM7_1]|nr:hypothetical protein RAAC3_TM7C00001G0463 [Candidatus Saccharibacteria bacterium RAAC3_TM7_1]
MKTIQGQYSRERGAVSIFIVIFTALLVTVVTVGFVQLIVQNQQQASQADLSQSAYDSALAGVEDAKRALALDKKCRASNNTVTGVNCVQLHTALVSSECSTLQQIFNGANSGETIVRRQGSSGNADVALDQAYTCVKIIQNTPDYRRSGLTSERSHLIPLRVAPGQSFNQVEVEWFTKKDSGLDDSTPAALTYPQVSPPLLPADTDGWGGDQTPPLLRAQLIQTGSNFSLSDFDNQSGDGSDANTLFLYPALVGSSSYSFAQDNRLTGVNSPKQVVCDRNTYTNGGYACKVTLTLPRPIGTADLRQRNALLRLSVLYNTTRYRITLKNNGTPINFYGVQSEVDATGRANDLFRRVEARVELDSTDFPYPEETVYLYGSLCKDFYVTNRAQHYDAGKCEPSYGAEEVTP